MSKSIKLTKDPIWSLLRKVTIPASVGSLFQTFYNLVDTWFAGRISAEAISAIAKSFPIYFTIIAVGVGLGAATNALIGNSIGEKKERVASMYVAQSLIFALTVSIFVTLFGLNASNYLLGIMGSDADGIALTREYLDIIFFGGVIYSDEHLTIPHPLCHERDFVLQPMKEIAPDFIHPVMQESISEMNATLIGY